MTMPPLSLAAAYCLADYRRWRPAKAFRAYRGRKVKTNKHVLSRRVHRAMRKEQRQRLRRR